MSGPQKNKNRRNCPIVESQRILSMSADIARRSLATMGERARLTKARQLFHEKLSGLHPR